MPDRLLASLGWAVAICLWGWLLVGCQTTAPTTKVSGLTVRWKTDPPHAWLDLECALAFHKKTHGDFQVNVWPHGSTPHWTAAAPDAINVPRRANVETGLLVTAAWSLIPHELEHRRRHRAGEPQPPLADEYSDVAFKRAVNAEKNAVRAACETRMVPAARPAPAQPVSPRRLLS